MDKKIIEEDSQFGEIGVILRKSREALGITKEELAAKLNTTMAVVSRIEESTGSVSTKFVRKYAKALGKKVNLEII